MSSSDDALHAASAPRGGASDDDEMDLDEMDEEVEEAEAASASASSSSASDDSSYEDEDDGEDEEVAPPAGARARGKRARVPNGINDAASSDGGQSAAPASSGQDDFPGAGESEESEDDDEDDDNDEDEDDDDDDSDDDVPLAQKLKSSRGRNAARMPHGRANGTAARSVRSDTVVDDDDDEDEDVAKRPVVAADDDDDDDDDIPLAMQLGKRASNGTGKKKKSSKTPLRKANAKAKAPAKPKKPVKKSVVKKAVKPVAKAPRGTAKKAKSPDDDTPARKYELPGQRRDAPATNDPLRLFYSTMYEERKKMRKPSPLAETWMMHHGLLSHAVAEKVFQARRK